MKFEKYLLLLILFLLPTFVMAEDCVKGMQWFEKGKAVPKEDFERQEFYFEKAYAECGSNLEILDYWAWTYIYQEKFKKALKVAEHGFDIDPFDFKTNFNTAYIKTLTGDHDDAIKYYQNSYRSANGKQDYELWVYGYQAANYWFNKDWELALDTYYKSLEIAKDKSSDLCSIAWLHSSCGTKAICDGEKGLTFAKKAYNLDKNSYYTNQCLAIAYARNGEYDKAVEHITYAKDTFDSSGLLGIYKTLDTILDNQVRLFNVGKPYTEE